MTALGAACARGAGAVIPRVAVIAVHGVGSPPPDATAKAVAELLMQRPPDGVEYSWADERRVTIPTDKVDTGEREEPGLAVKVRRAFTSHAGDRTNLGVSDTDFENTIEVAHRPDIAFMRKLLTGYKSDRDPYGTVEVVGERRAAGKTSSYVHVFELHWADLSHVGTGITRITGAVLQLVQHISHLGRKTVDIAAQVAKARERLRDVAKARLDDSRKANAPPGVLQELQGEASEAEESARAAGPSYAWAAYSWVYSWVMRTFTVLVPVASALMLAFVLLFVPAAVKLEWRYPIGLSLAALILTVVGALVCYKFVDRKRGAWYFVVYMLGIIMWTIRVWVRAVDPIGDGTVLVGWAVALLAVAAYVRLVVEYDNSRSGARSFGLVALGGVVLRALYLQQEYGGLNFGDAESVRTFGFVGFQLSFVLLMATWALLWLSVFVSVLCRLYLRWIAVDKPALETVKRAVWTARVTLGGAVFGSFVALLVGYQSFVYLAEKVAGRFNLFPPALPGKGFLAIVRLPSLPHGFYCAAYPGAKWKCSEAFLSDLIGRSGTSGFVLAMLGLILVLALSSWFIVLVAISAIRKPLSKEDVEEEADEKKRQRMEKQRVEDGSRLGSWMTNGFQCLRLAGSILAWSLLFAIMVGIAIDYWPEFGQWARTVSPQWLALRLNTAWAGDVVARLAVAVLASAATIGAARLRAEALATKARPALGVVLDVDNYLRESPESATPRAMIAERFVSLLRYLEKRGEFDRVVIVSHSQGTVITADLLRFLSLGLDPDSPDRGLVQPGKYRLLTMGSPLRQLYGSNFPHLYAWVTASDPNPPVKRTAAPAGTTPVITSKAPDPADLRVDRWVNLYTSGDYVGRNLWSDDDWDGLWEPRAQTIVGGDRRERCLGAGTHTRYWTSADVAQEVDELIAN